MKFGLLGPFSVGHADEELDLGPPQRRAVLAVLACSPNRVVSTDRLIDAVWGEDGSRQVLGGLQAHISRLRKLLGSDRIDTRSSGYVLRVEPDEVDVDVFERLAAEGRQTIEEGSDPAGSRLLEEALALWRGEPLAEFAYADWAQTEIGRLNEIKLSVFEDWNDSQLRLGHHRDLIGELERLTNVHAGRERLWGQLITALYRSDRQADALRTFSKLRAFLTDELGIDLSASLQDLELAILKQDPELRATPTTASPHNLPTQLTAFIGRTQQLAELAKLLAGARLVTLTGVGGSGKTRLALEAAAAAADEYADGVRLIQLGPIGSADLVASAVADSVGIREHADQPLIEIVAQQLRNKKMLLVVDNCEHLLQTAADTVNALLKAAPGLRIMATSRQRLTVTGEVTFPVPPMSIPTADMVDPKLLLRVEAVKLFAVRAETSRPGFRITIESASAVSDICRHLDGIPLAIELAAARLGSLSPKQIASHLDRRLGILTMADRTALPHQQTLRATIDWSHKLLSQTEQTLFRRLSVFSGSFSLEAAQQICGDSELTPLDVVDLLPALVEKSLVTVDHTRIATRYRLLETIREYSSERLAKAGETEAVQNRHASFYIALAEESEPQLRTAKQPETLVSFEEENDNFRQTLQWALDTGQAEIGLRLAGALYRFWYDRSKFLEGRNWIDSLFALSGPVPETVRAKALLGIGTLATEHIYNDMAVAALEAAADIYRRLPSRGQTDRELASALLNLAVALFEAGDDIRPGPLFEECLELSRQTGDQWGVALGLDNLAMVAARTGNHQEAMAYVAESRAISGELGPNRLGGTYQAASYIDLERGDFEAAIGNLEKTSDYYLEAGELSRAAYFRALLAHAHLEAGHVDRAIELFMPDASRTLADPEYQTHPGFIAELAVMRVGLDLAVHRPERAAVLLGAIPRLVAAGAYPEHRETLGRYRETTERLLDPETLETALARGATMTIEEVRSLITEPTSLPRRPRANSAAAIRSKDPSGSSHDPLQGISYRNLPVV